MGHPDWNEPYGRTDTKSPMVDSSMVHVGREGGTRSAMTTTDVPPLRWLPGIGGTMGSGVESPHSRTPG
jgi:hypothetical protein